MAVVFYTLRLMDAIDFIKVPIAKVVTRVEQRPTAWTDVLSTLRASSEKAGDGEILRSINATFQLLASLPPANWDIVCGVELPPHLHAQLVHVVTECIRAKIEGSFRGGVFSREMLMGSALEANIAAAQHLPLAIPILQEYGNLCMHSPHNLRVRESAVNVSSEVVNASMPPLPRTSLAFLQVFPLVPRLEEVGFVRAECIHACSTIAEMLVDTSVAALHEWASAEAVVFRSLLQYHPSLYGDPIVRKHISLAAAYIWMLQFTTCFPELECVFTSDYWKRASAVVREDRVQGGRAVSM